MSRSTVQRICATLLRRSAYFARNFQYPALKLARVEHGTAVLAATKRLTTLLRDSLYLPALSLMRGDHDQHAAPESDDEFNQRYIDNFHRWDIDGWEIRKAMNDLLGMDLVPDPKVVTAGLIACRQVNDIALAIRWLEGCKEKCADDTKLLYPHIIEQIRPTLKSLGVPTPEELNYDTPQLALKSVYDM